MKKTYLFLIVNICLWLYSLCSLFKVLSAPANSFDLSLKKRLTSIRSAVGLQWFNLRHFIFSWQTIVFLLGVAALVFVVFRLWSITFIFLAILTVMTGLWTAYYVVNNQYILTNYFTLIVLAISLGNIWLSAKASNL